MTIVKDRLTQRQKDLNGKQWYKDKIESFDKVSIKNIGFGVNTEYQRIKSNYQLFNDTVNMDDFAHVIKPYGETGDEQNMPADFKNRDILSGKLKSLHGLEMKRPLSHKIIAVNDEATTRREQELFGRMKQYVISEIMKPIEMEIRKAEQEKLKGKELSEEEMQMIEAEIQKELQAQTPEEVLRYMKREHQDPAEAMMSQIFTYVVKKENLKDKFNKGFFHGTISAYEIYWIGIVNDEPVMRVVNPLYFNCEKSPDTDFIEDGEWAVCEWRMSPSQVVEFFGSELSDKEIDEIYEISAGAIANEVNLDENFFFFNGETRSYRNVRVFHATWKSLKKIGFLTYMEDGVEVQTIVDETYKLQEGDVRIEWEWIPEVHEGFKIGNDIYKKMGPVPGQYNDLNNLYQSKLSYHGVVYDNTNSEPVALVDRMKPWQYYYNIIMYRIEMLMASDKGRIMLLNMNMIPKTSGIDIQKWLYYADALKIGFLDPNEEGNKNSSLEVTNAVKEVDLGMVADIQKYIQLAEYVEQKCGRVVGITPEIEGQIDNNALVGNTQQNIAMASNIIEPYFTVHNQVKRNTLTSLLEMSKVAYSTESGNKKLVYVLDDLSIETLKVDNMLLDSSTFGLFVSDSNEDWQTKQYLQQLSQAALQNNKAELSDLIKILKSNSLQETEELLKVAEDKAANHEREMEAMKTENQKQLMQQQEAYAEKQHERELELVMVKERERRETELQKQAMLSMGFNEDKDLDKDGEPDVMEIFRKGKEAEIRERKQQLEEKKFEHQKQMDEKKLQVDKLKAQKSKNA